MAAGVGDPNLALIPGEAAEVANSEAIRTIVEILRTMIGQFNETVQDSDDEQVGEQLINLLTYLDQQMTTKE
jgi:hypothetical protein